MDGHQPFKLRYDLIYDPGGAIGDNGDTADLVIFRDVRHRQAFDIIASRSENAGDPGQYAGLVGDGQRPDVTLAPFFRGVHYFFSSSVRKSVVSVKGVPVRVDLGGRRTIKKK